MPIKQLPIYLKFVDSVKKNNVQEVAELLYEHAFLSTQLEKMMPKTELTPYMFCTQNNDMTELADVLVIFGAVPQKKIPASQEAPLTPPVGSDAPSLASAEIKLSTLLKKSLPEQKQEMIKKYHLDCIQKLYILTGVRPFTCSRTLHRDGTHGTHLRFMMPHLEKPSVEMALTLFNIPFNDGFGSKTHSYISILPEHYRKIDSYFHSQDLPNDGTLKNNPPNLSIDNLEPENKVALCNILYSTKFLVALEERNNNQYSLDEIMQFLAKFTLKNSLCFEYLEEKGHTFKHVTPQLAAVTEQKSSQILHFSPHSPYATKSNDAVPNKTNEKEPETDLSKKITFVNF